MGEILGLGISHYPPLAGRDENMTGILRGTLRDPDIPAELKDPRSGLLDFPSLRDGRTVYLCWKLDEPTIGYWHPIETGFAGRQPL